MLNKWQKSISFLPCSHGHFNLHKQYDDNKGLKDGTYFFSKFPTPHLWKYYTLSLGTLKLMAISGLQGCQPRHPGCKRWVWETTDPDHWHRTKYQTWHPSTWLPHQPAGWPEKSHLLSEPPFPYFCKVRMKTIPPSTSSWCYVEPGSQCVWKLLTGSQL